MPDASRNYQAQPQAGYAAIERVPSRSTVGAGGAGDTQSRRPSEHPPRGSRSGELPKPLHLRPACDERSPGISEDKICQRQRCGDNTRADGEARRGGGELRAARGETYRKKKQDGVDPY